ncbi:DUF3800 domain-containing protein [Rhizosphaericola mali]|uniref:DUF3800 domain-containing protein n=1 Tax=Rhizosphaericola mali TaxID=2545455 RepID=A0A5P2G311_9BACT|nr:DUF3800 domain-containing protein [Rhizosphaericola mali]QES89108.1 DUF3800 domain-containing protein [Rhizosphaericola mali]
MNKVIAFADEFGNNSFDFNNQGSHFIISSIIVNLNELKSFESQVEKIREKYFQKGEIKSSKVGANYSRRIKILNALLELNFSIYAVVIDKQKLYSEGFKYKQSFYKFLNGILYKELFRTFPQLELKVDEHGGNDFMKSFKKYVEKNHIRTLFEGAEFQIHKSHNELGIQVADFIAGTLGYIYDITKKTSNSYKFYEIISSKLISVNNFPKKYKIENFADNNLYAEFDDTISNISLRKIFDFIDTTHATNDNKLDQLNFMKLLVLFHQSNHHKKYTTSDQFIKHLNVNRETKLSKEKFTNIIGGLRDRGILIASSREGYKIPSTSNEIRKYIRHGKNILFPIIDRIEKCRTSILLATNNSLDILEDEEFKDLKKIIEKIYE